jgi:hypothetical protein
LPTYPVSQYSAGYQPVTQQTLGYLPIPQTSVALLPTGSYQTTLNKVPTTYYRPVTTLDPNTGTTVTTLQPCTSYQQQVLRTPLIAPTTNSYYAAYGGYGAGVAAAPGQSTLSIPSTVGTSGLTSVNQIPSTGAVVNPTPLITSSAGYLPTTIQAIPSIPYNNAPVVAYPTTIAPTVVQNPANTYLNNTAPLYPSTQTYSPATAYPSATTQPQVSGYTPSTTQYPGTSSNSVVQADGTIITPLGSSTSMTPSANNLSAPSMLNSNGSTYSSSTYNSSPYNGSNANQVLPNDSVLPSTNSYQVQPGTSNPALNGNVVPQNSSSNPAIPSDPASLTPPSLPPISSNSSSRDNMASTNYDHSKMVTIDRPARTSFTRNPVESSSANSGSAFVNDKDVAAASTYANSIQTPALLKPRANGNEQIQGVRPPEGYSPKPYWRSKQQSAAPGALYNDQEKTARNELQVVNPSNDGRGSALRSNAQVQFVGGQQLTNSISDQSKVETAVAVEPRSSETSTAPMLKRNALSGLRLPASTPVVTDSFQAVK